MAAPLRTDVSHAARLLREGKLVAFGTETVYGLGANAFDPRAVARVFEAKNRPRFDPLIVHLPDRGRIGDVVESFSEAASRLADAFWPGPLTLVLPKRPQVPDLVTAGRPTVGVRVPALAMTRQLLAEAGVPVAAPSANPFGRISPTTAAHVADQLGDVVDYILDCGPCAVGLESTVVDMSYDRPVLLRPGGVTLESLEAVVGPIRTAEPTTDGPQRAPGMLSRHYSPRTPLVIADRPGPGARCEGLLTFRPEPSATAFGVVEILSESGDLAEAAANFFAALRRLDAAGLDRIVALPFPDRGLGRALNDRLRRAAATA